MATNKKTTHYCEKCGKTLKADRFYASNNLEKYPHDGKLNQCKDCITMHLDNWEPETYLWILEECDVPYIPAKWNELLTRYTANGNKITGTTILGRYLSVMRLGQYKKYRWKDTELLQQIADNEKRQAMERSGYSEAEITKAIAEGSVDVPEKPTPPPEPEDFGTTEVVAEKNDYEKELEEELTAEDKKMLRLKWGSTYRLDELVHLEKLYTEMMKSYDIQGAGHIDTLKLICKTSLKCHQLIDLGDIEGYQKVSKVYDQLMKSGKFTAAQNKEEAGDFVDSISELVSVCETEGFIPKFYDGNPNDMVDETIKDMKEYTRDLIMEEENLGNLIETALKTIEKEQEEELESERELGYEDLEELKDEDIEEYLDFIEEEKENSFNEDSDNSLDNNVEE